MLHGLGWGIFLIAISPQHFKALGLGVAITAYTLGMRHAFDADHIAAIDNTTRKLMNEGKRPMSVGFFFSLGHSTVVFLLGVGLTIASKAVFGQVENTGSSLQSFGGILGTSISGAFLYVIAILNLIILIGIVRLFISMRRGAYDEEEMERNLANRGMMSRFFKKFMNTIKSPGRMYPVGFLFGLGFDTASEVALLAVTAGAAESLLPWYAVLSLPILFAAGMSLLDTIDGSFMNFAYGWAFSNPIRKIYYNITITGLSVVVALLIGTVELAGLLGDELKLTGGLWTPLEEFNINVAGFMIAGLFVVTWIAAVSIWKFGRIQERWEAAAIKNSQV